MTFPTAEAEQAYNLGQRAAARAIEAAGACPPDDVIESVEALFDLYLDGAKRECGAYALGWFIEGWDDTYRKELDAMNTAADDGDRAYEAAVDRELRGEPDATDWAFAPWYGRPAELNQLIDWSKP